MSRSDFFIKQLTLKSNLHNFAQDLIIKIQVGSVTWVCPIKAQSKSIVTEPHAGKGNASGSSKTD